MPSEVLVVVAVVTCPVMILLGSIGQKAGEQAGQKKIFNACLSGIGICLLVATICLLYLKER